MALKTLFTMTLEGLIRDYHRLQVAKSSYEDELSSGSLSPSSLQQNIRRYLSQVNPLLEKIARLSKGELEYSDARLSFVGLAPKRFEFSLSEAMGILEEAIPIVNAAIKRIAKLGYDTNEAKKLATALSVIYWVLDEVGTKPIPHEKEEALAEKKAKLDQEEEALIEAIETYVEEKRTDFYGLDIPSYCEAEPLIDQAIPLGKSSASIDEGFYRFAKDHVSDFEVEGTPLRLCKECPAVFMEADPDLLSSDDLDLVLEHIIQEAFLHFKAKNLQVAGIEDKINPPVLKPILQNLSIAVSPSLCFAPSVANDETSASALLNKLFNEFNERVSKFKAFRALSSNGRCDDIYAYNQENPNDAIPFVLFIYKDYPSFHQNEADRKMLLRLLENGWKVGIFTLIIGNNLESKPKYSGDRPLPALDLGELGIRRIKADKEGATLGGAPFLFTELSLPHLRYFDLLKKRLEQSSKYYIDSILEEEKDCPYYQRIKIPVGESNGRRIYFETATESKPYPFSIVTGSTGSGKSAFVHTLMMSAAYKYSPKEIEIHLVDFKSADKSTDFDGYRYVPGVENLYIPHVKYVSLKSRPENAIDVTNYIIKLMAERSRYGKFEEYNRKAKPEDRIPQIYAIIDEYENMIKGGDGLDDNSIEKITLVSQINTNIETILKRARVFGIGIIFAGQDFTLKGKAPNQINTRFAFYNSESTLRACFPDPIDNFNKFPSDKKQSVGYCYVGSEGDNNPQYTHIAYAGSVDSPRLHALAKRIREKYPEDTAAHQQTVIGGNGSAIPEKGSYPSWEEEIQAKAETMKMSFDSEEEFLSSGSLDTLRLLRPLALGESSSSKMTIALDYSFDEGKLGYYAYATKADLSRIEANVGLAFLYQTRSLSYKKARLLYLDGSNDGYEASFASYAKAHPYLTKAIEVISNPLDIAKRIMELAEGLDKPRQKPLFVILHDLDFLTKENQKKWLSFEKKEEARPKDEKKEAEFAAKRERMEASSGAKASPLLSGFLSGIRVDAGLPQEKEEEKEFSYLELLSALKKLYAQGSASNIFLLVTSPSYLSLSKVLFDSMKDLEKEMNRQAIYGSFEMYKTKNRDLVPNANLAYVINPTGGSTVRLYHYASKEAASWWEELDRAFQED